jgi:hypothetical protein
MFRSGRVFDLKGTFFSKFKQRLNAPNEMVIGLVAQEMIVLAKFTNFTNCLASTSCDVMTCSEPLNTCWIVNALKGILATIEKICKNYPRIEFWIWVHKTDHGFSEPGSLTSADPGARNQTAG